HHVLGYCARATGRTEDARPGKSADSVDWSRGNTNSTVSCPCPTPWWRPISAEILLLVQPAGLRVLPTREYWQAEVIPRSGHAENAPAPGGVPASPGAPAWWRWCCHLDRHQSRPHRR